MPILHSSLVRQASPLLRPYLSQQQRYLKGLPKRIPKNTSLTPQTIPSSQPSKEEVLQKMEGRSITHTWDLVVVYDKPSINIFMGQQYANHCRDETKKRIVINWQSLDRTQALKNVRLDAPFISFASASLTDPRVTALMRVISGSAIRLNTQKSAVIYYKPMAAWDDKGVSLSVPLKEGKGTVGESTGDVSLEFQKGKIEETDLFPGGSAELGEYFKKWFQENPLKYRLGSLNFSSGTDFKPTKFKVLTQPLNSNAKEDGEDAGEGAVLQFIASNKNDREGTLPIADYPYLIPQGYGGALVLGSTVLFKDFIKPVYEKKLKEGATKQDEEAMEAVDTFSSKAASLKAKPGYKKGLPMKVDWTAKDAKKVERNYFYSSNYSAKETNNGKRADPEAVLFPYAEVNNPDVSYTVKASERKIMQEWNCVSDIRFAYEEQNQGSNFCNRVIDTRKEGLDYAVTLPLVPTIDLEGSVSFRPSDGNNPSVLDPLTKDTHIPPRGKFSYNAWPEFVQDAAKRKAFKESAEASLTKAMGDATQITLPEIKTFLFQNLLFPGQHILKLAPGADDVAVPGDLVMFGQIDPKKTTLTIKSPLKKGIVIVGSKEPVPFTAEIGGQQAKDVQWSVEPVSEGGTIDPATGEYTPPQAISETSMPIVVTAKTPDSQKEASTVLYLVPSPLCVTATQTLEEQEEEMGSFSTVKEGDENKIKFHANNLLEDSHNNIAWSIMDDDGKVGEVEDNGEYALPDPFPEGFTPVTVQAKLEDSKACSQAQLGLIHQDARHEFHVSPPYAEWPALSPDFKAGEGISFTVRKNDSFKPLKWDVFPPEMGSVNAPVYDSDAKVYTVTYTPPVSIQQPSTVVLRVTHEDNGENNPNRYGYALIALSPGNTPEKTVDNISDFNRNDEKGSVSTQSGDENKAARMEAETPFPKGILTSLYEKGAGLGLFSRTSASEANKEASCIPSYTTMMRNR